MKFRTVEDAQLFLIEVGRVDMINSIDENFVPDSDLEEGFIKSRKELVDKIKDFRKSANQKANWRRNRYAIMKGIRGFHDSTAGKRMHRNLGRFIATKESFPKTVGDLVEALKALSSIKTHLIIDLLYYRSLDESVSFEFVLDEAMPIIDNMITDLRKNDIAKITSDDFEFITRLVEPEAIRINLAEVYGVDVKIIDRTWDEAYEELKKQGLDEEQDNFYSLLIDKIKEKCIKR